MGLDVHTGAQRTVEVLRSLHQLRTALTQVTVTLQCE